MNLKIQQITKVLLATKRENYLLILLKPCQYLSIQNSLCFCSFENQEIISVYRILTLETDRK